MPEMPDAREDHRESQAVGGGDHVGVSHPLNQEKTPIVAER